MHTVPEVKGQQQSCAHRCMLAFIRLIQSPNPTAAHHSRGAASFFFKNHIFIISMLCVLETYRGRLLLRSARRPHVLLEPEIGPEPPGILSPSKSQSRLASIELNDRSAFNRPNPTVASKVTVRYRVQRIGRKKAVNSGPGLGFRVEGGRYTGLLDSCRPQVPSVADLLLGEVPFRVVWGSRFELPASGFRVEAERGAFRVRG